MNADQKSKILGLLDAGDTGAAIDFLQDTGLETLSRHFQAWSAEQLVEHFEADFPGDSRVRDQIAMLRNNDATDTERETARRAASSAAWMAWGAVNTGNGAATEKRTKALDAALIAANKRAFVAGSCTYHFMITLQAEKLREMVNEAIQEIEE